MKLKAVVQGIRKVAEQPFQFIKGIVSYLSDHDWRLYSAGLSFYAVISLAPLAVFAVIVGGVVFGTEVARTELHDAIEAQAGDQVAGLVEGLAEGAGDLTSLSIASLVGVFVLLWSSTNLFNQVRSALHETWGIERPAHEARGMVRAIARFFRYRLFAALGTLSFGTLFLALLGLRVALSLVETQAGTFLDLPFWLWDLVDIGVALLFVTVFVRIVYRLLPDQSPRGLAPWIGGIVTGLLLVVGRTGVALYLSVGAVGSAYGAAGALIVFLAWAYWSAFVFLFGARLTYVLANRWGRWPQPQKNLLHGVEEAAPKKAETIAAEEAAAGVPIEARTAVHEAVLRSQAGEPGPSASADQP